jgi:hypothetical protein
LAWLINNGWQQQQQQQQQRQFAGWSLQQMVSGGRQCK